MEIKIKMFDRYKEMNDILEKVGKEFTEFADKCASNDVDNLAIMASVLYMISEIMSFALMYQEKDFWDEILGRLSNDAKRCAEMNIDYVKEQTNK